MSKFFVPALFFSASAFADSGQLSAPAMTGMIDLKGILFGIGSELLPLFAILFGLWSLREFFTSRYFTDRRMKAKGYERYEPFMVKRNGSYYRKSSFGSSVSSGWEISKGGVHYKSLGPVDDGKDGLDWSAVRAAELAAMRKQRQGG